MKAMKDPVICYWMRKSLGSSLCGLEMTGFRTGSESLVGDCQGGLDWAVGGDQPSLAQL